MELSCDLSLGDGYKSPLQISRILSEAWFRKNAFCLSCESDELVPTTRNTRACDFTCRFCEETYELKSFKLRPSKRIVDGAYSSLISRIREGRSPTLMLLERSESWKVLGLTAIHPLFLTPQAVEKRKPLAATARRAGWVGCNIRLDLIGQDALLDVIRAGVPSDRTLLRESFRKLNRLREVPVYQRGWTTLTLAVIRGLATRQFSLRDLYAREHLFGAIYPRNRNIRPKIRQQLQVLRDLGYVEFSGDGAYRLII